MRRQPAVRRLRRAGRTPGGSPLPPRLISGFGITLLLQFHLNYFRRMASESDTYDFTWLDPTRKFTFYKIENLEKGKLKSARGRR